MKAQKVNMNTYRNNTTKNWEIYRSQALELNQEIWRCIKMLKTLNSSENQIISWKIKKWNCFQSYLEENIRALLEVNSQK